MDEESASETTGIDWNGPTAQFWVDHDARYDALLARQGDALLAAAAPVSGEQVLDIGCGTGSTTIRAGEAAAPGVALGVDISQAMIDKARSRVGESGVANVRFEVADVQTVDLGSARFDLAISRFGVMFFADPIVAFANIRAAMRPGGRLAFVCWAEQNRNEFWTLYADMLAPILGPSADAAPPAGPFALADPAFVQSVLERAGWRDITVSELLEPVNVGPNADDAVAFELADPPTANALAAADPAVAKQAIADLTAALAERERPDGVWLEATAWLVTTTAE